MQYLIIGEVDKWTCLGGIYGKFKYFCTVLVQRRINGSRSFDPANHLIRAVSSSGNVRLLFYEMATKTPLRGSLVKLLSTICRTFCRILVELRLK